MSNYPPGVSDTDIPGNRPEDEEFEKAIEWLYDCGLTGAEIKTVVCGYLEKRRKPVMLETKEEDGKIFIEQYSDSMGGFKVELMGNTFDLYELKIDSGDECYVGQYDDILEAIKEGRRWT